MDLSGAQGELPIPMHSAASPYFALHHHNGAALSPAAVVAEEEGFKSRGGGGAGGVRYRECLKNHAAAIGGSATDGCGEFMPGGEDGSLDALRCSACGCHRNFHRKELGHLASALMAHHHHRGLLLAALPSPAPTQMVMPLSAMHTSESDEARPLQAAAAARKRFRTKFTAEQKERMLGFAEEVGWRLQKLEDAVVQRFCQEVGVKRRVLKVWMHNNKHSLARRHDHPPPPPPPPQPEPGDDGPPPQLR